jgi:hypothetical protein
VYNPRRRLREITEDDVYFQGKAVEEALSSDGTVVEDNSTNEDALGKRSPPSKKPR